MLVTDLPLTPEQEALVAEHAQLAFSVARAYANKHNAQADDFVADAFIGLRCAARTFDSSRGWKFSTFASQRARGEIIDAIRRERGRFGQKEFARAGWTTDRNGDPVDPTEQLATEDVFSGDVSDQWWWNHLTELEQVVVRIKHDGGTAKDAADAYGCSESRVWQIIKGLEAKLTRLLREGKPIELAVRAIADPIAFIRRLKARELWTVDQLRFIKDNYLKMDSRRLGTILNCSRGSIWTYAGRLGVRKIGLWTPQKDEFLKTHRTDSWQFCAQQLGITPTAVHNRVRRLGIAMKWLRAPDRQRIRELNAAGQTCADIAIQIGVTDECIRVNLHRMRCMLAKRDEKKRMETYRKRHGESCASGILRNRRLAALGYSDITTGQALILEALKRIGVPADKRRIAIEVAAIIAERGWKYRLTWKSVGEGARKLDASGLICRSKAFKTALAMHWLPSQKILSFPT